MFATRSQIAMYGLSERGRLRPDNQDWIRTDPAAGLFVLADGMGGTRGGAQASRIAGGHLHRTMRRWLAWNRLLPWRRRAPHLLRAMEQALLGANGQVLAAATRDRALKDMGTTLVAGLVRDRTCLAVAVGDSRLYRLRDGRLERATRDQTLAARLLAEGFLEADDPRLSRYRNVLTDVVGREQPPRIQRLCLSLQPGDRLLACSDGLSGAVSDDDLLTVLRRAEPLEGLARRLIEMANDAGGRDNVSVILVEPSRPTVPAMASPLEDAQSASVTPDQS